MKIPNLVDCYLTDNKILPYGIHEADFAMVEERFAINARRERLFEGLLDAAKVFASAGCKYLYLNGSYVTDKTYPGDYDACWDPNGVDLVKLFESFPTDRLTQKEKYLGEFYETTAASREFGRDMLQFFRFAREHIPTGVQVPKGIILIDISQDAMIQSG